MPLINIEYDTTVVTNDDALVLSGALREIVISATGIEDVFVYANTSKITVAVAPIEIFVRMTAQKIKDTDVLMNELKSQIISWKAKADFKHPINLTLIPMDWNVEIGI